MKYTKLQYESFNIYVHAHYEITGRFEDVVPLQEFNDKGAKFCNKNNIPFFGKRSNSQLILASGRLKALKCVKLEHINNSKTWYFIGLRKLHFPLKYKEALELINKTSVNSLDFSKCNKHKKYYIVYCVTDHTNGMKYIGKHSTDNLNDGYMGSGSTLKLNQQLKGIENFTKEILHICKDQAQMDYLEALEIEKVKAYENHLYYNVKKESLN